MFLRDCGAAAAARRLPGAATSCRVRCPRQPATSAPPLPATLVDRRDTLQKRGGGPAGGALVVMGSESLGTGRWMAQIGGGDEGLG